MKEPSLCRNSVPRLARLKSLARGGLGTIISPPKRADNGGRDRDRTCDPFHVKEVLSR